MPITVSGLAYVSAKTRKRSVGGVGGVSGAGLDLIFDFFTTTILSRLGNGVTILR